VATNLLLSWTRVSAQRRILELGLTFDRVKPKYQDGEGKTL
jgi:hypothetical protein